jgi:hypothetical protein
VKRLPLLALATSAAICLLCATAPAAPNIQQDDLGPVPDTGQIAHQTTYVAISPDCHDIAMVVKTDNDAELRINGKSIATADEISDVVFSPAGVRLAYAARRGKTWYAVFDSQETSVGPSAPSNLLISPDARHLFYLTATADSQTAVVDGKPQKAYSQIAQVTISFAGFHYAYAGLGNDSLWRVVRDGEETGQAYTSVRQIRFSRDGQQLAFVAANAAGESVQRDATVYGPYYRVTSPPAFSPDGEHLTFGAYQRAPGAPLDESGYPVLDAYRVVDGNAVKSAPTTQILYSYGAEGAHVLIAELHLLFNTNGTEFVYIDGLNCAGGGVTEDVTLSPGGARFACAGHGVLVIDNRRIGYLHHVGPPLFSPDSRRVAYATADDPSKIWSMNVDDDRLPDSLVLPTADFVNSKWLANTELTDQLSIDNGHSYNGQIPYHFDPDGTLVYFRIEGGHLYRVHWKPDGATALPTTRP